MLLETGVGKGFKKLDFCVSRIQVPPTKFPTNRLDSLLSSPHLAIRKSSLGKASKTLQVQHSTSVLPARSSQNHGIPPWAAGQLSSHHTAFCASQRTPCLQRFFPEEKIRLLKVKSCAFRC